MANNKELSQFANVVGYNGGNIGINDNDPDTRLSVNSGATNVVAKFTSTDQNAWIQFRDNSTTDTAVMVGADGDNLLLRSGSNERLRIDSAGRLLVGNTSFPDSDLFVIRGNANDDNEAFMSLVRGSAPSNNQNIGMLSFHGNGNQTEAARITALRDGGTWTAGSSHPGRLVFSTTENGDSSPTERLRIANAGETTLRPATYGMGVRSIASSSSVNTAYFGAHSSTSMSTGTITFEVYTNGNVKNTNNSYSQLSDERLKENIINAPSQWDDIKSLQIRKYNFRDGNGYDTHTQIGLVAQEVESVSPGLVQETPVREDATPVLDAEGNELEATKSVLTSVLYMKAIKALQEAQTRIETLESQHTDLLARVTALEGS